MCIFDMTELAICTVAVSAITDKKKARTYMYVNNNKNYCCNNNNNNNNT